VSEIDDDQQPPVTTRPVVPAPDAQVTPDPEAEAEVEPEPDVEPELVVPDDVETIFVTTAPDGASACQMPPAPWPFTSPAFLSPEKR
jgi:hypothetical protein